MGYLHFENVPILVNPSPYVMDIDKKQQAHLGLVLDERDAVLAEKSGYMLREMDNGLETYKYMVLRAPSPSFKERNYSDHPDIWDCEQLKKFLGCPHRAFFMARKLTILTASFKVKDSAKMKVAYITDLEMDEDL